MKLDLERVKELKEQGLVFTNQHPIYSNLILIKYLPLCTYTSAWNDVTLKCRGIVVDTSNYEIITHVMGKFFNLEEPFGESTKGSIPNEPFKAFAKRDGSNINVGWHEGEAVVTSSGSFISDHAQEAVRLFNDKYKVSFDVMKQKHQDKSFVFEFESPRYRIVLDNGSEDNLYLLAIRDTDTGKEYDIYSSDFKDLDFPRPEMYEITSLEGVKEFQNLDLQGKEGIILLFESGFRLKVKFENYLKLHRFFTKTTLYALWEILKANQNVEEAFSSLIKNIPDEFYQQVRKHEQDLRDAFVLKTQEMKAIFDSIPKDIARKDQAIFITKNYKQYAGLLFIMLDNKPFDKLIWDLVVPNKTESLF